MEINKRAWKDVVGLKPRGVQVRKTETGAVPEFNKMQYYGQCLRDPIAEIKHFHVGGLKVDQRLLGMIVTKILVPRGSNHSTLNEGDLILMYCIQHNIQVDWIYVFRDHMLKAKRLMDFRLPYVVLVSKFICGFGSMHWIAKSMISMICSTHSRPEMTLRMTKCGGCLGSCIASLCL